MEIGPLDSYYMSQPEPNRACLLAARAFILNSFPQLNEAWKYRMPFFCYGKKMFCYLWIDKKTHFPYLGIVEGRRIDHPDLHQGARARMKILTLDPGEDLPVHSIRNILNQALTFYV